MKLKEYIRKIMRIKVKEITGRASASGPSQKREIGDIRKLIDKMQRNYRPDTPSVDITKDGMER